MDTPLTHLWTIIQLWAVFKHCVTLLSIWFEKGPSDRHVYLFFVNQSSSSKCVLELPLVFENGFWRDVHYPNNIMTIKNVKFILRVVLEKVCLLKTVVFILWIIRPVSLVSSCLDIFLDQRVGQGQLFLLFYNDNCENWYKTYVIITFKISPNKKKKKKKKRGWIWRITTLSTQRLSATIILLWWDFLCELCNSDASTQISTRLFCLLAFFHCCSISSVQHWASRRLARLLSAASRDTYWQEGWTNCRPVEMLSWQQIDWQVLLWC